MAIAFLLFDFGPDEEAAQKARHRIDAWKQAFRLGNKVQWKLERHAPETRENAHEPKGRASKGGNEPPRGERQPGEARDERIRVLVRLDFSAHEKHLFQSWLERIPAEEPFKSVKPETIQRGTGDFDRTSERFDALD